MNLSLQRTGTKVNQCGLSYLTAIRSVQCQKSA